MSGIQFGPNGCKFKVGGGPCREKETLQIIQQFKQLYEAKLREIETEDGGGDNLEAKVCLQRDWIRDLTEQNEMLVRAVEELEREATDRVTMLEEKLKNTARSGSEAAIEVKEKDGRLKELEDQLKQMTAQMQAKETELAKVTQSMMDMRNALTIEVADKHDIILSLRRDVQQLEEQCRQSNKQTQFKDDIIKELRKEIKQLKAEVCLLQLLEPSQNSHEYPHIRSLHALDLNMGDHLLCSQTQDHKNIRAKNIKNNTRKNSANHKTHQEPLPFFKIYDTELDQIPASNSRVKNETSAAEDTSVLQLLNCHPNSKKEQELVPEIKWFFDDHKSLRKPRSKLTASNILREYYGVKERIGLYSIMKNTKEIPTKNFVKMPNYVSVKKFVTNFEQNVKK